MKKLLTSFVLIAALLAVAAPLFAHHGRGATYDMKKEVTLKGTVTEVAWRNPHVAIYMDVKDATAKSAKWHLELLTPNAMKRNGTSRP